MHILFKSFLLVFALYFLSACKKESAREECTSGKVCCKVGEEEFITDVIGHDSIGFLTGSYAYLEKNTYSGGATMIYLKVQGHDSDGNGDFYLDIRYPAVKDTSYTFDNTMRVHVDNPDKQPNGLYHWCDEFNATGTINITQMDTVAGLLSGDFGLVSTCYSMHQDGTLIYTPTNLTGTFDNLTLIKHGGPW